MKTRWSRNFLQILSILVALGAGSFLFQRSRTRLPASVDVEKVNRPDSVQIGCPLAGEIIGDKKTVHTFRFPIAPFNSQCESQDERCEGEVLDGSFPYLSCYDSTAKKCLYENNEILLGKSMDNPEQKIDGDCLQITQLTCQEEGLFSTSRLDHCEGLTRPGCQIFGQFVEIGEPILAYKERSVPLGNTCEFEYRMCQKNGKSSGSFEQSNCFVQHSENCLFGGRSYPHNFVLTAFDHPLAAKGERCHSEKRVCFNGSWSGSFAFATCEER